MLLSHRTSVKIRPEYSNIIGHMCYAASKLWNVCNYERHHYKELGLEKYPDWYYQKKEEWITRLKRLHYPLIVKPAMLGSSIGIEKANED